MIVRREFIDEFLSPSLEEVKSNLRITSSDLDSELLRLLRVSIQWAEHEIGRVIARSKITIEEFFNSEFGLNVTAYKVTRVEVDGFELNSNQYSIADNVLYIKEIKGKKMRIEFEAGMQQVPEDIKHAILLTIGYHFENPVDSVKTLPTQSELLLRPYRTWGVK